MTETETPTAPAVRIKEGEVISGNLSRPEQGFSHPRVITLK